MEQAYYEGLGTVIGIIIMVVLVPLLIVWLAKSSSNDIKDISNKLFPPKK
jgi:hypothetical protein